jgi:hypothetical protein
VGQTARHSIEYKRITGQVSDTRFEKCFDLTTAEFKLKAEVAMIKRIRAVALLFITADEGSPAKNREHKSAE